MQEIQLSRKDIPPLIVDASTNLHATEVLDSESCDDSDHDDTLWDWMTPTMMRLIELAGISCNALTKTNFYH
ncbi:hypothetical protein E3N88_07183 [Mikania micrantha]|uniref:Uncharacterized protein n=1 Tax=Mikania micrantha TaxID=192012 RepID=A0A5N6PSX3_9ASTR|nr:hypothetical protein E3N88_07183 [Mikania micrantha]